MTETAPSPHPLAQDLDHILKRTSPRVWDELTGARLFITGGTGFFGKWLLESWAWANRHRTLNAKAVVLARDPERFLKQFPHLAQDPSLEFLKGDLLDFKFPAGNFTHVLHAATPASVLMDRDEPERMTEIIVKGTDRVLKMARDAGKPRLLLTSSGAIYGPQPSDLSHIPETFEAPADSVSPSAYARGKREAERLCRRASNNGTPCVIARCFAFSGPHLPLDLQYALGNFIRDARAGGPIRVSGDGTAMRSYLYGADLAVWLWTLLTLGTPGRAYNVGSDQALSIGDLARKVARFYNCPVQIASSPVAGHRPSRYVPEIERAKRELGLKASIGIEEAIERTERFLLTNPYAPGMPPHP